jgi:hypothetical protein
MEILTSMLATIGSIFVTRDQKTGQIIVNAAPMIGLSIVSTTIGCSVDSEPFGQCMTTVLQSVAEVWNL